MEGRPSRSKNAWFRSVAALTKGQPLVDDPEVGGVRAISLEPFLIGMSSEWIASSRLYTLVVGPDGSSAGWNSEPDLPEA
jgi:hypothetical protein